MVWSRTKEWLTTEADEQSSTARRYQLVSYLTRLGEASHSGGWLNTSVYSGQYEWFLFMHSMSSVLAFQHSLGGVMSARTESQAT